MNIPLHVLMETTNDFSDDKKIGSGGYGNVYKGVYNGEDIAIKLLHQGSGFDMTQFRNEFVNLMSMKHPHVVRLIGYCYDIQHKLIKYEGKLEFCRYIYGVLCFEYLQGGSLDKYLDACAQGYRDRVWRTHFNIIKGVCEGLCFLHDGCGSRILHLDLKPANILLDNNMGAKIADFGLSRLFDGSSTHITNKVIGTERYMAPEYITQKLISTKCDVFSLGVVIIEVMDGRMDEYDFCHMDEVKMFIEQVKTKWSNWINTTASPFSSAELEQVETCIKIALQCVDLQRNNRPTVSKIISELKETEKWFPEEWRNPARFVLDQGLRPDPIKSGLVGGTAGSPQDIKEKPWHLESLTISYLGLVDAFTFSYIDQDGRKQTEGPWGEGYIGDKTETVLFGPSEFLEEVSGAYGNRFDGSVLVKSLTFVTNFGTYGPFGNPYQHNLPSTPFRFRADEDSSIVGFHGRSGRHIYSIGVYTCLSNKPTVKPRPAPGQNLPDPIKSGLVGGSAGSPRDIEEKPWRLESLTISYLGLLDAFSFSYTDQAGKTQSIGPWGEGYHDDKFESIRLGPSEVLEEVSGEYGNRFDGGVVVKSLTFVTNFRTYGPFGDPYQHNLPSTPFRFRADEDSSIVGFHGRSGRHIYSIGVYTVQSRPGQ